MQGKTIFLLRNITIYNDIPSCEKRKRPSQTNTPTTSCHHRRAMPRHKAKVWSAFGIAISFFWEMNLLMCHAMPLPELFFFFREDIKK
jgi:hypothetical protein